jgi:hypothetical protein
VSQQRPGDEEAAVREARVSAARPHQPGQASFRSILSEAVDWKPFPAFPPSVRLAVLVGDPSQPAPFVIRVKVPGGVKLMPHVHPEDRAYTVMSGVFYVGRGETFDPDKLEAYPPGAVIVLPGIEYVNADDDPRTKSK